MKTIKSIFFIIFILKFMFGNSQQLEFSTYLGSSAHDWIHDICIDKKGNIYVVGTSYSENFPNTPGKLSNKFNGGASDVFIAKFNSKGNLVFSTFLGGSGYDGNCQIALDPDGNIYISGVTDSEDFPTTNDAIDKSNNGGLDIFLTKIDSLCKTILYSTYLGGIDQDHHPMMVIDKSHNIYISGPTRSTDFPTTENAFDNTYNGTNEDGYYGDIFFCKIDGSKGSLEYSSFIGGSGEETVFGIDVDERGIAYITGTTSSLDFPSTNSFPGKGNERLTSQGTEAFLLALDCESPEIRYSVLFGGNGNDSGEQLCLDEDGNIFICGTTSSPSFPTTKGVFNEVFNKGYLTQDSKDIFVCKFNNSGEKIIFSTFLGGKKGDGRSDIFVTENGDILIGGGTSSEDFPATSNAFDKTMNGGDGKFAFSDAFCCILNSSATKILYSTFIGGSGDDNVFKLKAGNNGKVYIGGLTLSVDFPTSNAAFDKTYNGERDAFVLQFKPVY